MKKLLIILVLLIPVTIVYADFDDNTVYLPLIANKEVPDGLRISSADCNYIIIDWKNPKVVPDISQNAGFAVVTPNGGLTRFPTVHYWYHVKETLTWRYWVYYSFAPGTFYWLDAHVYGNNGGLFSAENGDQLWLPCPPHVEE